MRDITSKRDYLLLVMHPLLLPHVWSIFGRARMQLRDMVELSLSHRHVCKTVGRENTQSGTGDVHWTCDLDSGTLKEALHVVGQHSSNSGTGPQAGRQAGSVSGAPAMAVRRWQPANGP